MSKKYTPLYYEVHLKINIYKLPYVNTTFKNQNIEKIQHIITQNIFQNQNIKTTRVRITFRGSNLASLRFNTIHYIILHFIPLHTITLHYTPQHYNYNYTPLQSTKLNYTTLPSITFHYITLYYTPLQLHNYTPLH